MQDDPFALRSDALRRDPYPLYARLRREAPVYRSDAWSGFILTRYADVAAGFRDKRLSSDRSRAFGRGLPPALQEELAPVLRNVASWALLVDPPAHTRLRALVTKAFTPRVVERLTPKIAEL